MVQGLVGGMTDYSHQSFQDILEDLERYVRMTNETVNFVENSINKIEDYWKTEVDYDFKGIIAYSLKFYKTVCSEIAEINTEIQISVQDNHHKRLHKLGDKALEINHRIGEIWHSDHKYKGYGIESFRIVEGIYSETRDIAVTLVDISNLASRLEDFVGKTNSQNKPVSDRNFYEQEFVSQNRIDELKSIENTSFDLCRLIRLCEEINIALKKEGFLTVAILTRSIIDHIPPIFGVKNFNEVANNYNSTKSFKDSMNNLNNSTRKIADSFLHTHIRNREVLPNYVQINCSQDLDVLLAEIYRILK